MRALVVIAASVLIFFSGQAFAKTASCPCSPCKCSPCSCGGGGSKGGKHHEKEGRHEHSDVGVGVNVDLGGIGQHHREADPFAGGGDSASSTHTEVKHKSKTKETSQTNTFDQIRLTGREAKEENVPTVTNVSNDEETPPGSKAAGDKTDDKSGGSDNAPKTTDNPPPATGEKPVEKKFVPKPSWSKPIQDWLDSKQAINDAQADVKTAEDAYFAAFGHVLAKSPHYLELRKKQKEAYDKAQANGATQADKDAADKALKDYMAQGDALEKDFLNSPEGQAVNGKLIAAKKKLKAAQQAEVEAGKNIDDKTKKMVEKKMAKWEKTQLANNDQPKK